MEQNKEWTNIMECFANIQAATNDLERMLKEYKMWEPGEPI